MSDLIPANFAQMPVSSRFAGVAPVDDLSQGIQSSYGLIGYKGKVWSIRYRGDEQQLMRDDGDGPRGSIEVVILKASGQISKIWYEQGYVEGSSAPPDCFSNNGITPEEASVKKQCDSCALCPHNQWGSRTTPAGKAGKACADSKRVAVAPLADLNNEAYGGPMLLRIPAASLQDLASFGQKLQQMGYPYYAIGTKIAFDPAESYPKMVFSGLRPLNDAEADIVIGLRDSHTVQRILSESEFNPSLATTPAAAPKEQPFFEQAPELGSPNQQAAQPTTQQTAQPAKKAETKVPPVQPTEEPKKASGFGATAPAGQATQQAASQPVTQEVTEPEESDEDREIREAEEKLLAIRAAAQAKKAQKDAAGNAAATTAATQQHTASTPVQNQGTNATVSHSDDSQNVASSFEANLDAMLTKLLP